MTHMQWVFLPLRFIARARLVRSLATRPTLPAGASCVCTRMRDSHHGLLRVNTGVHSCSARLSVIVTVTKTIHCHLTDARVDRIPINIKRVPCCRFDLLLHDHRHVAWPDL